jgi:hypothetical protein
MGRFLFAIWVELPLYAWKRRSYSMAAAAAGAICFFWVALFVLSSFNLCGAFWVFGFPTFAGSFLLSEFNRVFIDVFKSALNFRRCRDSARQLVPAYLHQPRLSTQ